MIVAEQKPIKEILAMLPPVENLLVVGCDTCVTVCMAGGRKEVDLLCSTLRLTGNTAHAIHGTTVERQCDAEFLADMAETVSEHDAVLSMACGAGVQMMADFFTGVRIFPALNTLFMGSNDDAGYWTERCLGCGNCLLDVTGGIFPKTMCSKGLLNGPCGGSENGRCEVDPENLDCGWNLIYKRLEALGLLDTMEEIQPPVDWSKTHDGGPRRLIREDVKL